MFAGPNYILTIRSHAEKGFQSVRARCESEPELLKLGSGYVLYALIDAVVDRYFPLLDALETELEGIEDRIFAGGSPRENVEALYGLKQKLGVFRHAVAPLLEAVNNLYGARAPRICAEMKDYFRDISDHLQRLNQTIESIRDTIATAIAVNLSMISLQENETMKRLAAYGALVAVPTMIAGVYGMNFEHMPELDWKFGYATVVASHGRDRRLPVLSPAQGEVALMAAERTYFLGTHDEELERLGLQHRVWRPTVLDCWRRAGIGPGSKVLDVGAGPGLRRGGPRGDRGPRGPRRRRRALRALRRGGPRHAREPRPRERRVPRARPHDRPAAGRRHGRELVPLGRLLRRLAGAAARQDRGRDPPGRRRDLP